MCHISIRALVSASTRPILILMTPTATPKPLSPASPKLRNGRWEVSVSVPTDREGVRKQVAVGRFVALSQLKAWADAEHAGSNLNCMVTRYVARDGFRGTLAAKRVDGVWFSRDGITGQWLPA